MQGSYLTTQTTVRMNIELFHLHGSSTYMWVDIHKSFWIGPWLGWIQNWSVKQAQETFFFSLNINRIILQWLCILYFTTPSGPVLAIFIVWLSNMYNDILLLKIEEITVDRHTNTHTETKSKYFNGHGRLSQSEESECMWTHDKNGVMNYYNCRIFSRLVEPE